MLAFVFEYFVHIEVSRFKLNATVLGVVLSHFLQLAHGRCTSRSLDRVVVLRFLLKGLV